MRFGAHTGLVEQCQKAGVVYGIEADRVPEHCQMCIRDRVILLILWWRNFQLEYWCTFQLVSTSYIDSNALYSVKFWKR